MKTFYIVTVVTLMAARIQSAPILTSYNLISPGLVPGIIPSPQPAVPVAHPAVVENAAAEAQLPSELLNPFYKNPNIAAALAKESWFTNEEFPVHHREAEKIPRSEIFKIISRLQHRR